jgi:hypothetical protein
MSWEWVRAALSIAALVLAIFLAGIQVATPRTYVSRGDALPSGRPVPRANKANGIPVTPRDEAGEVGEPDAEGWQNWSGPAEEACCRDGAR